MSWRVSFDERKSLHFFANSKINKEIRRNQRWVADDVSDDALQRLVNLNSGLRPKLSRLVSVFGLSKRLIQEVKWNDPLSWLFICRNPACCPVYGRSNYSTKYWHNKVRLKKLLYLINTDFKIKKKTNYIFVIHVHKSFVCWNKQVALLSQRGRAMLRVCQYS